MEDIQAKVQEYMALDYPMRVEPIPEELGGGWVAYIPILGEKVFRATGETPEQALRELEELKEVFFEIAVENREKIPLPPAPRKTSYSGQILLRMRPSMHEELADLAEEEGVSLNSLIVSMLSRQCGAHGWTKELQKVLAEVNLSSRYVHWATSLYSYQSERTDKSAESSQFSVFSWTDFPKGGVHGGAKSKVEGKLAVSSSER